MLEEIKSNIARLVAQYEAERQRADGLAARLSASEEKCRVYKEQIADLNQQIDNLELMRAFGAEKDPAQARERIARLVREIDKCIKLLEN
ncbi:MAG: hypothetical protein IJV37_07370 [Bacteroidales bacterium]|nr:hypothetical protein [Bacteroidales bacterium]